MPRRINPDPHAMKVGQRIVLLQNEKMLTLAALADRCDMGKGHLSNVVHGLTIVTIQTLQRIAAGLDVSAGVLLAFPEDSPRERLMDQVGRLSLDECRELEEHLGEATVKAIIESSKATAVRSRKTA